jgi:cleavage and polyadenylation specificity factor subunit 4
MIGSIFLVMIYENIVYLFFPFLMSVSKILQPPGNLKFDFEDFVANQLGVILVKPETQEICQYFLKNQCRMGNKCAFTHPSKTKLVVCKHWLRGLCKKGERCEFLHEYNLKKMPECWFYAKIGECTNPECQYLHIDPNSKIRECAWYARGFCKHGAGCRHKHTRAAACPNYLTGFCPKGNNCQFGHPKYELPVMSGYQDEVVPISKEQQKYQQQQAQQKNSQIQGTYRPLSEVSCFKCGEKGHYANHCTKRMRFNNVQPS